MPIDLSKVTQQLLAVYAQKNFAEEQDLYEQSLSEFFKGSWPYIENAPFLDNWAIDAMAEHLEAVTYGQIKRLLINISPRCGKPIRQSEVVISKRGLIQLKDIIVSDYVWTHKGRWKKVLKVHEQGRLPVFKITTSSGREVVAAADHPFLTPNGWVNVVDLKPKNVLGLVPIHSLRGEDCGSQTVSDQEARLLGYLIGDGHCGITPNITCGDDTETKDIIDCVNSIGFSTNEVKYSLTKEGKYLRRISIISKDDKKRIEGKGPVRRWMNSHDLFGKNSYNKVVPKLIMEGNYSVVSNFIGAYWSCDGWVQYRGKDRKDIRLGCCSVNRALLEQIQLLLLRLGINSILRKKTANIKTRKQGDKYISWNLDISTQEDVVRFSRIISMFHEKNDRILSSVDLDVGFDRILLEDAIEFVEPAGEELCRCLTVEDDHGFTANGFAVHNTNLTSIAWPAWTWAQKNRSYLSGPQVKFMCGSYNDKLTLTNSNKIRRLIGSPFYQKYWANRFDLREDQNTKCLAADTKILMADGSTKFINEIAIGDYVLSYDEATKRKVIDKVVHVWKSGNKSCRKITLYDGTSVTATLDHRLYGWNDWVFVKDMNIGDPIAVVQDTMPHLDWRNISNIEDVGEVETWHLQTEKTSLFFAEGILSHNSHFDNTAGGGLIATSVRGTLLGVGGDILCFPYHSLVQTEIGPIQIGELVERKAKIKVWSYNLETKNIELKPIMAWHKNPGRQLVRVTTDDDSSFECTYDHKVLTDNGYIEAGLLAIGSNLSTTLSNKVKMFPHFIKVVSIDIIQDLPPNTYCLTIQENHNMLIHGGKSSVICANCVDDPHNTSEAESESERETAENWWKELSSTRLNNPQLTPIVVNMQRLHTKDISGLILDGEEDYVHLMIPMRYDERRKCVTVVLPRYQVDKLGNDLPEELQIEWTDPRETPGELMWPERFDEKAVRRMEAGLGPIMASGRLQQQPIPAGGAIIKRDYWQSWDDVEAAKYNLEWNDEPGHRKEFPDFELIIASLDTAFGDKEENDFSAMTVWGVFVDHNRNPRVMLVYGWAKKLPLHGDEVEQKSGEAGLNFRERRKKSWGLVELVADTCKTYHVTRLLVENKARGYDVAKEINRLYARENWGVELVNPVKDKVTRAHSVVPVFSNKIVYAPTGLAWAGGRSSDGKESHDGVITECEYFPKGEHDDYVDTVTQAIMWLRNNGILIRSEEYEAQLEDEATYASPKASVAEIYGV